MSDEPKPRPNARPNLQLNIDDDVAQGMYSNFQVVGSNETEFVLDFAYVQPTQPVGKIRSRVIVSPKHAKAMVRMLQERVADYEARYGEIPLPRPLPPMPGGGLPN